MIQTIGKFITGIGLGIAALFGVHQQATPAPVQSQPQQTFGAFSPSGGGTYRLSSSISTTDSTVPLSSFKEPISNIAYTMTYLGSSVGYGTLEPGNTSKSEFISFTGVTQNSNGTASLTGVTRGLTRTPQGSLCTASSTLASTHSGQSIFILSDSPCLFAQYAVKSNNETITGTWTFNAFPVTPSTPAATVSVAGFTTLGTALQTASSTAAASGPGGTTYVLPTNNATDTPSIGCAAGYTAIVGAGCTVIANLTGKLSANWIATSSNYTWTGTHTFNNPVAFASTTTGLDWQFVASSTITSGTTANLVATAQTTTWRHYRIEVQGFTVSSDNYAMRFNGDSGLTYAYRNVFNGISGTVQNSDNEIQITPGAFDSTNKIFFTVDIDNALGNQVRPFTWTGTLASTTFAGGAAHVPSVLSGSGAYYAAASSTPISSFTFRSYNAAGILATSSITVWGSNN